MTWQHVSWLSDYWQDHPPVQSMVQAYLGIKPRTPADDEVDTQALLSFPGGAPG